MSDKEFVDHYKVLGIKFDVSNKDLTKAYRKLALRLHPDKNRDDPNAAEKFDAMKKSYSILKDPEKRSKFDVKIKARRGREIKYQQMDSRKRAFKDALDKRERVAEKRQRSGISKVHATNPAAILLAKKKALHLENERLILEYDKRQSVLESQRIDLNSTSPHTSSSDSLLSTLEAAERIIFAKLDTAASNICRGTKK